MTIFLLIAMWIIIIAAFAACWCYYHLGYKDGHSDGRDAERERQQTGQLLARNRARAMIGARQPWMLPPPRPAFTPRELLAEPSDTGTFRVTDTGELRAIRERGDKIVADGKRMAAQP